MVRVIMSSMNISIDESIAYTSNASVSTCTNVSEGGI